MAKNFTFAAIIKYSISVITRHAAAYISGDNI